jgi:hypothetical protein
MHPTSTDRLTFGNLYALVIRFLTRMSLDPTWLFISLIPSGIGFVLFVYGKKYGRWPQLAAGLLLMVYPYFTQTLVPLVVTGAAIGTMLWYAIRLGW